MPDGTTTMSKPLVLVVEDEAALVTMLRYNLEKQGFRVDEAIDGAEAINRIAEAQPGRKPRSGVLQNAASRIGTCLSGSG